MNKILLLFLFLFSGICQAQEHLRKPIVLGAGAIDSTQIEKQLDEQLDDGYYVGPHYAIGSNQLSKFQQMSLEEKLMMYADECYNDSTVKYMYFHLASDYGYQILDTNNDTSYYSCTGKRSHNHYTKKVHHRKPTFEGFIEWLKKKQ